SGCVLGVPEVLAEEQVVGRAFVETLAATNPKGERLRVTRPGFRFEEAFPTPPPPPRLGADTAQWLERLGYGADDIARLQTSRVVACATECTADARTTSVDIQ